MQTPSVGRIVHYRSYGTPGGEFDQACRAAVVTIVHNDREVGLAVLNPTGLFFRPTADFHDPAESHDEECRYEACHRGGTWHWPERQ